MSNLVQVDVSDWDNVDFKLIDHPDINRDYPEPADIHEMWDEFQKQVELIRDKQIKASTKQIPALFKPKEQ